MPGFQASSPYSFPILAKQSDRKGQPPQLLEAALCMELTFIKYTTSASGGIHSGNPGLCTGHTKSYAGKVPWMRRWFARFSKR